MQKPRLSFWQIWNAEFRIFGIQFGWGLQMANMSAIYQYLEPKSRSLRFSGWRAADGLDRATHRRLCERPGVERSGPTAALFPDRRHSGEPGAIFMPKSGTVWMAAGLLWLLDASVNITMEPFRAFVGDLLPKEQRKSGFAMQSLLIGLGAVLSSALPYVLTNWLHITNDAAHETIPKTVRLSFYIGSVIFFFAVLYTIRTTKEYPPDDMPAFERAKAESAGLGAFQEVAPGWLNAVHQCGSLRFYQFFT
jgi:maltose/moltooligosaccharide transporter